MFRKLIAHRKLLIAALVFLVLVGIADYRLLLVPIALALPMCVLGIPVLLIALAVRKGRRTWEEHESHAAGQDYYRYYN